MREIESAWKKQLPSPGTSMIFLPQVSAQVFMSSKPSWVVQFSYDFDFGTELGVPEFVFFGVFDKGA